MAISTYQTYLFIGDGSTPVSTLYGDATKLVPIKSFSDLGGEPETLETTTLEDKSQTHIMGIQSYDNLTFEANYTKADYDKMWAVSALNPDNNTDAKRTRDIYVVMGKDGSDGVFYCKGQCNAFVTGGGVNEVVGLTITVTPVTEINPLPADKKATIVDVNLTVGSAS